MSGNTIWAGQLCPPMTVERAVLAEIQAHPSDAPRLTQREIASALQCSTRAVACAVRNLRRLGLFPSITTTTESPA